MKKFAIKILLVFSVICIVGSISYTLDWFIINPPPHDYSFSMFHFFVLGPLMACWILIPSLIFAFFPVIKYKIKHIGYWFPIIIIMLLCLYVIITGSNFYSMDVRNAKDLLVWMISWSILGYILLFASSYRKVLIVVNSLGLGYFILGIFTTVLALCN